MLTQENRRRGRPPAAAADETRQRIIQAARLVFSERGYDGASFQAVAARVGLTRPAINHYFPTKRALYRETMDDTNEIVIGAGIKQAEGQTGLVARLTAFISAAVKADSENPAVSAFIISGIVESRRNPQWKDTENGSIKIAREFLMRVINDAIECGEVVADIDASVLTETLLAIVAGVGLYAGYTKNPGGMLAIVEVLRPLLESALWRPAD